MRVRIMAIALCTANPPPSFLWASPLEMGSAACIWIDQVDKTFPDVRKGCLAATDVP
jgi:hypothetical protein